MLYYEGIAIVLQNMKKILRITSLFSIIAGACMVLGGVGGVVYTYDNIVKEGITTPKDAPIPSVPVRGPFTLRSQADAIEHHTLSSTEGKRYAELPRFVTKLDESGNPVLDAEGKEVQVTNDTRMLWIPAMALISALNLGVLAYAFSAFVALIGILFVLNGVALHAIRMRL